MSDRRYRPIAKVEYRWHWRPSKWCVQRYTSPSGKLVVWWFGPLSRFHTKVERFPK